MDGACGTHRREKEVKRVLLGRHKGKRPLERRSLGGIIILKWILNN
jgi:hypothetical protein